MMNRHTVYRVGNATITRVTDIVIDQFTPDRLFLNWNDYRDQLRPEWKLPGTMSPEGDRVLLSIHTWVIQHQGKVILVDTGSGNDKDRPHAPYFHHLKTDYLKRLAAVGVSPEDVDVVLTTHLHVDHVGWNTRLESGLWVPTFPNAKYFFSKLEHQYYNDPANHNERNRTSFQVQQDSVNPIVDAGLATLLHTVDTEPVNGFTLYPTPGHSPGHVSIVFRSAVETALFSGDIVHHPFQVFAPELMTIFDANTEQASRTRLWGLNFAAEHDSVLFSPHFAGSSAGRVISSNGNFTWKFI